MSELFEKGLAIVAKWWELTRSTAPLPRRTILADLCRSSCDRVLLGRRIWTRPGLTAVAAAF